MTTSESSTDPKVAEEFGLARDFALKYPGEFAGVLASFDSSLAVQVLRSLPNDTLIPVAAHLHQKVASAIFDSYEAGQLAELLNDASLDDASRIMSRLTSQQRSNVIRLVADDKKKRALGQFARIGKSTVGEMADKDFLWFQSSMSLDQVRSTIKSTASRDAVETALVLNDDETVLGLLDYISLAQAERSETLSSCVARTTLVPAEARPHTVVHFEDWHRINRLPVVDQNNMPIGVLRWSQLAELAQSATSEDQTESFSIVYEMLDTMIEFGRSLLSLSSRP